MPMIYSVGSIIGPSIGGALANPLGRTPADDPNESSSIFWKFPYLLPNIVASAFFLISILIGWLFLRETLEERRDLPDVGLATGERLISFCRDPVGTFKAAFQGRHQTKYSALPGSQHKVDEEIAMKKLKGPLKAPSYGEVLTKQTLLYLISYVIPPSIDVFNPAFPVNAKSQANLGQVALAMHNTSFDQMLPVLMHMANSGPEVQKSSLPFMFSRGFGLGTI
jgi:MFS family permease